MPIKQNTVTITLDEYKELLLKDRPSNHEKELLAKILDVIIASLKYTTSSWDEVMPNVEVKNSKEMMKEVLMVLKVLDKELYMKIWNGVITEERKRKEEEARVKHMNQAKEIRNQED